jgi:dolichyl-phosphate beta-glucosyltransferase
MPGRQPEISVVLPAYNEADRIADSLRELSAYLIGAHPNHEIIVVDDGSSDRTADELVALAADWPTLKPIHLPGNLGKGCATRTGVLAARGRWILCSDADLSVPVEELARLLARAQTCQVVIGSRSMAGASITRRRDLGRVCMGLAYNRLACWVAGGRFTDTQCGFKLYHREAARDIFSRQQIDGFAFDVEVLFLALHLGYQVGEEPVQWNNDGDSSVRMAIDPLQMLSDLLRIRWIHRRL